MKENRSFEEKLNEWLLNNKGKGLLKHSNSKRYVIKVVKEKEIDSFEKLELFINAEDFSKYSKTGKILKKFYDEYYVVDEVKDAEEVKEYNDNEYILVEKVEKVNIKNSYINLIRNKINKIESELNEKDVDDNMINKLKNIYDMFNDYF